VHGFDVALVKRMRFYRNRIYPRLVSALGDPASIRDRRGQLLPEARGTVLEIGVGSGANFNHYDPARVDKIYALEPNPGMVQLAEGRLRRTALSVEFLGVPGERIPLADACVDTVVSTFTLCTIPAVVDALRGLHRVMRPAGRLIFSDSFSSNEPDSIGAVAGRASRSDVSDTTTLLATSVDAFGDAWHGTTHNALREC
jgi:ubiquinone/menaquinone biosynthesis C-methylase UbiE